MQILWVITPAHTMGALPSLNLLGTCWLVFLCSSRLIISNKTHKLATVLKAGGGFDCNRGKLKQG